MASFVMPEVLENENGWGPAPNSCPDELRHLPFAPFSKNDRLGRACEWSATTRERDRRWQKNKQEEPSPFVYEQVDEEGFHLVDTKTTAKPKWGPGARRGPMGQAGRGGRGGFGGRDWHERGRDGQSVQKAGFNAQKAGSRFGARGGRGGGRGFDTWRDKPQRVRISSVEVKPEWLALDGQQNAEDFTLSLSQMEKLREEDEPRPEELAMIGSLFLVDKTVDKASVRSSISLRKVPEPKPFHLSAMEDPVIKKLASLGKGNIFTTDVALAVLMAAPRSVNSWDMVVQRSGSSLFLDVREGSSIYDTTVNETAVDAPDDEQKESMNSMSQLYAEASYINHCFLQQCLLKQQAPVNTEDGDKALRDAWAGRPNDVVLPQGKSYRYRRWELSEDLNLIVRCEVDAALRTRDDSLAYITIKALNEFDSKISGIDWRQKLESQKAAVLANELKNNRNKLARWTCQALIAGADYIKVGFVSRHHAKDPNTHFILGQQLYKPEEFAKQIELKTDNAWGIVVNVMQHLMQLPATSDESGVPLSKYLMLKDPNKPHINFYQVPADAFDYEDQDEDNEDNKNRDDDHDSDFE